MNKLALHAALLDEGARQGIADPTLMLSLAHAENGAPGYEMNYGMTGSGGYHPGWRGAERQVYGAVNLVKHLEGVYQSETKNSPSEGDGSYSQNFLYFLAHGGQSYPGRHENDESGENANYFTSIAQNYYELKGRSDLLTPKEG